MTFCIITHVNHFKEDKKYYAYAPYVREMNLWFKHVDKVVVVAPGNRQDKTVLDIAYQHPDITFKKVAPFDVTSFKSLFKTLFVLPSIVYSIYKAMKESDHIHLRCAGNMALLGCFVQILFPKKKKTAKYAGNWDPNAKETFTITLQKKILNNTFLTRNMQIMVYGEWENSSKNVKSFFTATYTDEELQKATKEEALIEDNRFNINKDRLTTLLY